MKRRALITGATSGIGLELAKVSAAKGNDLVLVARREQELNTIAQELSSNHGVHVATIAADLVEPHAARTVFNQVQHQGLDIDILINNAGYGLYGAFLETDAEAEAGMIQLNMVALTQLSKLFLPAMVQRSWGRILNVASTAAFMPGPLMAVYYATKAYVLSLSEALNEELKHTGVHVTALCPGPTRTGFQSSANMEASKLVQGKIMDATKVAEAGYAAMLAGDPLIIPGAVNKIQAFAPRILPRRMVPATVRRAQERVEH